MILIAIIAVPLAIHDHQKREQARQKATELNYIKRLVGEWHEQVVSGAAGGGDVEMSEGLSPTRPRPKRRWSLAGLMVLIAIIAVPLALYIRRPKIDEYPERAAWQALSESRGVTKRQSPSKPQKVGPEGTTALPSTGSLRP